MKPGSRQPVQNSTTAKQDTTVWKRSARECEIFIKTLEQALEMCDLVCIPVKRTASGMHRIDIFGPRCVVQHSELISSAVTCARAQSHYRKITCTGPDASHASWAFRKLWVTLEWAHATGETCPHKNRKTTKTNTINTHQYSVLFLDY